MATKSDQQLASKEAGLFRQVVKFYESKQYKKGIKAADQVLRKSPDHGETLAMKGLILSLQDKKQEGFELVRKGLTHNLKSHVCWHVYGLLWRQDNNYDEAIKSYKNALRQDPENLQILRDMSQLQIQMREYPGFIQTRRTLLHLKSSARNNWITLAIAYHLNKEYDLAVQILKSFEGIQQQDSSQPGEDFEQSEMLLYKAMILEEGGKLQQALEQLEANKSELKDQLGYEEARARLLLNLGRSSEAEDCYRSLVAINPDNYGYIDGLLKALGLDRGSADADIAKLSSLFKELSTKFPKNSSLQRIPLDFLSHNEVEEGKIWSKKATTAIARQDHTMEIPTKEGGDAFREALLEYMEKPLKKGVPSLFSDLKSLYKSSAKSQIIEDVFKAHLAKVQASSRDGEELGEEVLWTQLFLANHYNKLGRTGQALELVEKCIKQFPEEIESFTVKSKILKHAGDLEGAADAAWIAQDMDKADRFLNCTAAKALFRANHMEWGDEIAALFTKATGQANYLHEMQCMWYEIEIGSAFFRTRDYGRALKNFLAVVKHFDTIQEDQFDFHTYCIRKMTLRSYISMLRMEDSLLENETYAKAAGLSVRVYIDLADEPSRSAQENENEERLLAELSLEERKKYKLKKKKEAQKKAKESEKKAQEEAAQAAARDKEAKGKSKPEKSKETDPDPNGAQLASVAEPLKEASKLLQSLRGFAGHRLETHTLSFEVALRTNKDLLALQAIKKAAALVGAAHPEVHRMIVRLAHKTNLPSASQNGHLQQDKTESSKSAVNKILADQLRQLLGDNTLQGFNERFVSEHSQDSLHHKIIAAEMQNLLGSSQASAAINSLKTDIANATELSHADWVELHQSLSRKSSEASIAQSVFDTCQAKFPWSNYFKGEKTTEASVLKARFSS